MIPFSYWNLGDLRPTMKFNSRVLKAPSSNERAEIRHFRECDNGYSVNSYLLQLLAGQGPHSSFLLLPSIICAYEC